MEDEDDEDLEKRHLQVIQQPELVSSSLAATIQMLKAQGQTESNSFMVSSRSSDSKSIKKEVVQGDNQFDL
ncbi:hypothetical protein ABTD04_20850, partial [Acinetobacter baumannii]